MAVLLPSDNYDAVRAALDVTLDASTLPDSVISLDIYAGAAARDVLVIDADAATRTGDDLLHAQAAAVYFCAARLVGALPVLESERDFAGNQYTRKVTSSAERAASLWALGSAELDAYLETDPTLADVPTMFAAAHGRRGRW